MPRMIQSTFARWWFVAISALVLALFTTCATELVWRGHSDRKTLESRNPALTAPSIDGEPIWNGAAVEQHQHSARAFSLGSSTEYKSCRDRGRKILYAFDNPGRAPRISFTSFSQLEDWGWTKTELPDWIVGADLDEYATELNARGFSVEAPPMRGIKWEHTKETNHNGKRYPPTGGVYSLFLSLDQGLIVRSSSYGPAWQVEHRNGLSRSWRDGDPLPDLRSWSDVAYLTWLQYSIPSNRQKLSIIVSLDATNDITRRVVQEALRKDSVKSGVPPKWPGHTFTQSKRQVLSLSSDGIYAAVLGTPNLLGSGWLALQHGDLGDKKVGDVTVYDSSETAGDASSFQLSILVELVARST